jgi:hypothetical protein
MNNTPLSNHKQQLHAAYGELFASKKPLAVTFTANRDLPFTGLKSLLKTFQRNIDERRLGSRFYEHPFDERLEFLVAPEHLDAGNPHFHGLLVPPNDDLERFGLDGLVLEYRAEWQSVAPAGDLHAQAIHDVAGWIGYSSKEHSLATGDKVIWSHVDFVSPKAARSRG